MGRSSTSSSSDEGKGSKSKKRRKVRKEKKASKKSKRDKDSRRKTGEQDDFLAEVEQEDVERLLLSLLQVSVDVETELLDVFKQLDSFSVVYLQDLADARLRKKLRHLFRALLVDEVQGDHGKGWRKRAGSKFSLVKYVKRLCTELRPQANASRVSPRLPSSETHVSTKGDQDAKQHAVVFDADEAVQRAEEAVQRWREEQPAVCSSSAEGALPTEVPGKRTAPAEGTPAREEWMLEAPAYLRCLATKDECGTKKRQILQQKKLEDEEAIRAKVVMEEWNKARKLKSLREMREEGDFTEGTEAYKRWKQNMDACRNAWGRREAEQTIEREFKDAKNGQPWQRFDRDRDLQVIPQVSKEDYQKLLEQTKLTSRFKSSWETSFL